MDTVGIVTASNFSAHGIDFAQIHALLHSSQESELRDLVLTDSVRKVLEYEKYTEMVVPYAEQNPLHAAIIMRILHLRLTTFMQETDLLTVLSDQDVHKGHIVLLQQLVHDCSEMFVKALHVTEQQQVEQIATDVVCMPDYEYYLANHPFVQQTTASKTIVSTYESRNGCVIDIFLKALMFFAILFFIGFLSGTVGNPHAPSFLALPIGIALVTGIYFLFRTIHTWQNKAAYNAAKKHMEHAEKRPLNMQRYTSLHQKFSDEATAQSLQHASQQRILTFFGQPLTPIIRHDFVSYRAEVSAIAEVLVRSSEVLVVLCERQVQIARNMDFTAYLAVEFAQKVHHYDDITDYATQQHQTDLHHELLILTQFGLHADEFVTLVVKFSDDVKLVQRIIDAGNESYIEQLAKKRAVIQQMIIDTAVLKQVASILVARVADAKLSAKYIFTSTS